MRYPMLGLTAAFVCLVAFAGVTLEWLFANGHSSTVVAMASGAFFSWLWAKEQMR